MLSQLFWNSVCFHCLNLIFSIDLSPRSGIHCMNYRQWLSKLTQNDMFKNITSSRHCVTFNRLVAKTLAASIVLKRLSALWFYWTLGYKLCTVAFFPLLEHFYIICAILYCTWKPNGNTFIIGSVFSLLLFTIAKIQNPHKHKYLNCSASLLFGLFINIPSLSVPISYNNACLDSRCRRWVTLSPGIMTLTTRGSNTDVYHTLLFLPLDWVCSCQHNVNRGDCLVSAD